MISFYLETMRFSPSHVPCIDSISSCLDAESAAKIFETHMINLKKMYLNVRIYILAKNQIIKKTLSGRLGKLSGISLKLGNKTTLFTSS